MVQVVEISVDQSKIQSKIQAIHFSSKTFRKKNMNRILLRIWCFLALSSMSTHPSGTTFIRTPPNRIVSPLRGLVDVNLSTVWGMDAE